MVPGPDSGPFVLGLRSALQKLGDFPPKKEHCQVAECQDDSLCTSHSLQEDRSSWIGKDEAGVHINPAALDLRDQVSPWYPCLGFRSSSAKGNQASPFHSSHRQNFSISLDLGAQGKIGPRAMKDAILINSNTRRERSLFQWLSETLKKQDNKIHLHLMNCKSSKKNCLL